MTVSETLEIQRFAERAQQILECELTALYRLERPAELVGVRVAYRSDRGVFEIRTYYPGGRAHRVGIQAGPDQAAASNALERHLEELTRFVFHNIVVQDPAYLAAQFEWLTSYEAHLGVRWADNAMVGVDAGLDISGIAAFRADVRFGHAMLRHGLVPDSFLKAYARAEALLLEWLSPEQRHQYEERKEFIAIGSDTGKQYRITYGRQMNVYELDAKGRPICGFCFVPEGDLAPCDCMLAQKIALETAERKTLKKANVFSDDRPRRRWLSVHWSRG